jgi:hypothetical protein
MALSKEFYLEEIKSKYPNSYNKSLEDLPVKDLEDMLDFLDEALGKADGGSIGIEVLFGSKVPAAPSQLVEESEIVLGYRGDDAARSDRASGRSAGRADPGGGVDRSAVSGGSQYARNVMAQNIANQNKKNKIGTAKNVFGIISPFINPTSTLGKVKKAFDIYNVYDRFKNVDPTIEDLTLGVDSNLRADLTKSQKKALGKQKMGYDMGLFSIDDVRKNIEPLGDPDKPATNEEIKEFFQAKDGGRVGLFMGGPALEGQALDIYNSMNAYGFTDQEIADALSARGLYTPAGSGTTTTAPEGIIGAQLNQDRDDGPKGDFGLFGDLDKSTEKTFTKNVYTEIGPGKFDFVPTEVTGYKNVKTGNYQTEAGKNINHLGLEVPTIAGMLFDKNFGKGPQVGDIEGTFTKGIPTNLFKNPFGIFQKQQATLKEIQDMNKKAVDDLRAKQAAEEAARQRDAAVASGLDAAIREGRDTSGFGRPSSGAYAEGAGMGVGGGYASDYFGADGGSVPTGLATRFKPRRR